MSNPPNTPEGSDPGQVDQQFDPTIRRVPLNERQAALLGGLDGLKDAEALEAISDIGAESFDLEVFDELFPQMLGDVDDSIPLGKRVKPVDRLLSGIDRYVAGLMASSQEVTGNNAPTGLYEKFAERAAWMLTIRHRGQLPSTADEIIEASRGFASVQDVDKPRHRRNALIQGYTIASAMTTIDSLDSIRPHHSERRLLGDLKHVNDGLFEHSMVLRQYGLKTALVKAVAGGRISDWMVIDSENDFADIVENDISTTKAEDRKILGEFIGTTTRFLDTGPVYTMFDDGSYTMDLKGKFENKLNQSVADMALQLRADGAIVSLYDSDLTPLAAALGKLNALEVFRAEVITIFTDLVLPAHVVDNSKDANPRDPQTPSSNKRIRTIMNLAVARIRLFENKGDEIIEEAKKEARRRPRDHPVTGFTRPLAEGHRANPEANELCIKYLKRPLEPGETFVKPHRRGSTPEDEANIEGHRANRTIAGGSVAIKGTTDPPLDK